MPNYYGFNPMTAGALTCPTCGYMPTGGPMMGMMGGPCAQPMAMGGPMMGGPMMGGPAMGMGMGFPYPTPQMGPWFGGPTTWGGTFPGMYPGAGWTYAEGLPNDDQIREMIYDAIDADPVIPFESDINVEVTGGVVTLTGTVPNKRIKHAIGDDAWWVPGVWDVNNGLEIVGRRARAAAPGRRPTAMPTPTKETKKTK
ncbi:MAG: BON domain-containing protein [Chloroflexi bacterium]|nr:BON domain-containing protein [Chloroflexota bacterium]MDA8187793.1 BON domain-containing protein [Dehalococcoidales bacterium]